jgi:Holliday junction resolvase RusA-like endonuclease
MKIIIPSNPITKKNHGRIVQKKFSSGKSIPIMLPSEAYSKYEKLCKEYIPKIEKPIDYPINLKCTYYMETKRKCDITNLLQATCDILVKFKILEDDNYTIVSSVDGTQVFYDKENPRVEIEITKKDL